MNIQEFERVFQAKNPQEKEIFAEEVVLFLDSFGFPAPSIIREKSNQFLLARYKNEFGEIPGPKSKTPPIHEKRYKAPGMYELLFEIVDGHNEDHS